MDLAMQWFCAADRDRSGRISAAELKSVLRNNDFIR